MATQKVRRRPIGKLSLFDDVRAASAVPTHTPSAPCASPIDVSPVAISELTGDNPDDPTEPIVLQSDHLFAISGTSESDHLCTADDFVTAAAARFDSNLAAIEVLMSIEASSRQASPDEQQVLARFSGFGDSTFEPAFRLTPMRKEDQPWVERGQRLRELVNESEWESLQRARLNAFFTTPDIIRAIWEGLIRLGLGDLPDPRILEPAAGVGRFLGLQPPQMAERSHRTAIELDALTARMLKQLYPRVAVHALAFQDAPLRDDWFDVAVSNVPFGDFPVVDRTFLKAGQRFLTRSIHKLLLREIAYESVAWWGPCLHHFAVHAGRAVSGAGPSPPAPECRSVGRGTSAIGHIPRHPRGDGSGLHAQAAPSARAYGWFRRHPTVSPASRPSDLLEYATARTLEVAQVPAYGIGLFSRLDHVGQTRPLVHQCPSTPRAFHRDWESSRSAVPPSSRSAADTPSAR